jgi:UDP-N-acetylmuramoyl-tripeptide--D-alanyl-D-alanine ligase
MAELGCSAEEGHQLVGLTAKTQGIDQMYCLGQYGEAYQEGFGKKISLFDHQEALVQLLWQDIQSIRAKGKTLAVLVKGSRSSHMETVITQLQAMMTSHAQENQ